MSKKKFKEVPSLTTKANDPNSYENISFDSFKDMTIVYEPDYYVPSYKLAKGECVDLTSSSSSSSSSSLSKPRRRKTIIEDCN